MIYIKALFNKDTYREKITSITNLRFVSFQIWKCVLLLFSLLSLRLINYIFVVNRYITFTFSLGVFIKLFLLGIGIDYIKLYLFKHNQNQNGVFERIVKLFLVPSQSTFAFFFLLILTQMNIISIKRVFSIISTTSSNDFDDDNQPTSSSQGSDFTLLLSYSLLYSFQVINLNSFYKWPKHNLTRIDSFKAGGKKGIRKSFKSTLYHIIIGAFYFILKHSTLKIGSNLMIYSIMVFYCETYQYVSYRLLKCFTCSPINPDSNEIKNEVELISYPINFSSRSSFAIIHYLTIVNETLIRAYIQPKLYLNTALRETQVFKELKLKIDTLYTRLNEKMKMAYYAIKQQYKSGYSSGVMNWFDFTKNEIFEYETSPKIIDCITEIIYNKVLLLSTTKNQYSNNNNNINVKEINQNEEQYYILYLMDRLFGFEKILKELRDFINNDRDKGKGMINISNELRKIILKIQMKIKYLVHKNLKEKFITNYSENIQEIIKEFRI